MKRILVVVLALLAAAVPSRVQAQTTGIIAGHVFDQTGTPIRGVRVTVSSETQIGGARTTTTDDDGAFRIPALSPGRFNLTSSAPKLKSVVMPNVQVSPGVTTDLDIIMEVETAEEQVKIVEKAPLINTNRATVGESFDAEFIDQLPLSSRDYQGVAALTAGVTDFFGTGNPNVRGGTFFNNSYQVDGFQTTDPVTQTFGQNFSFNAMAAVEQQTAAFGAEGSNVLGGITNIVTKSGSNRFELDTTFTYTDQNLQFNRDSRDIGSNRLATLSLDVGGPVIKDRLWFYVSAQGINNTFTLPVEPGFPRHPSFSTLALNAFGKLTWQVSPRHKLELKVSFDPADRDNTSQSFLVEPEAEMHRYEETRFIGLSWHALLADNLVLVTRARFQDIRFEIDPQSCKWDPDGCENVAPEFDLVTGYQRKNGDSLLKDFRRSLGIQTDLEWFKDTRRFGNHDVKVGIRYDGHDNPSARTIPGDVEIFNAGTDPFAISQYCANDPKLSNGLCRPGWLRSEITGQELHAYVQDAWKPTRYLTITPGVAVHYGHSQDDQERVVTDIVAPSPSIQAAWDPTHDGKTVLRGSFSSNVDIGFLALASFTSRELYRKTCFWDTEAQAYVSRCRSSGGNTGTTVGLPCGPDGIGPDGTSCRTELRAPRLYEATAGAEREILTGISLGADLVYRKFVHQWEDLETNANWNRGGTGLRREGNWKSGRAEFVYDLETPDEATRRYVGLTTTLRKREGRLRVVASYTWAKYDGVADNSFASTFLDNPGQTPYYYGPLPTDFRHDARLQATYAFKPWLSAGVVYSFLSGRPYNRTYYDPEYGSFSAFATRRGYDTRGTINPDDDSPLRLPDLSELALQARANLRTFVKENVDVFADVLNLMALRTTTSVITQDGPFWGRQASRLPPTRVRLGLRYRF